MCFILFFSRKNIIFVILKAYFRIPNQLAIYMRINCTNCQDKNEVYIVAVCSSVCKSKTVVKVLVDKNFVQLIKFYYYMLNY